MLKEQIARYRRYLVNSLRHLTFKKIFNIAKIEFALATKKYCFKDFYPYLLFIDISNMCNLRCPLCKMGQRRMIQRKNVMNIENYMRIINPIKDYLLQIFLYNWGEPFLNKDIYQMIQFNTKQNIGTVVSSNLNIPIDGRRLIKTGLEHLVISGDGVTQDIYEKYRQGGNIETVFNNVRDIVKAKREAHSHNPYIEWQCLVTKHNEVYLDEIKKAALELGVNEVRFANINFFEVEDKKNAEEEWLPRNPNYRVFSCENIARMRPKNKPCFWLWRTAVINSDGGVVPCCVYDVPDWGNLFKEPLSTVWNNEKYTKARRGFKEGHKKNEIPLVCDSCRVPYILR